MKLILVLLHSSLFALQSRLAVDQTTALEKNNLPDTQCDGCGTRVPYFDILPALSLRLPKLLQYPLLPKTFHLVYHQSPTFDPSGLTIRSECGFQLQSSSHRQRALW